MRVYFGKEPIPSLDLMCDLLSVRKRNFAFLNLLPLSFEPNRKIVIYQRQENCDLSQTPPQLSIFPKKVPQVKSVEMW